MKESEMAAKEAIELIEPPLVIMVEVDKFEGCENRTDIKGCTKYMSPERQHTRIGGCAMDTRKVEKEKDNFKLNPLKASKRGGK
jgi:hypothetical protein